MLPVKLELVGVLQQVGELAHRFLLNLREDRGFRGLILIDLRLHLARVRIEHVGEFPPQSLGAGTRDKMMNFPHG